MPHNHPTITSGNCGPHRTNNAPPPSPSPSSRSFPGAFPLRPQRGQAYASPYGYRYPVSASTSSTKYHPSPSSPPPSSYHSGYSSHSTREQPHLQPVPENISQSGPSPQPPSPLPTPPLGVSLPSLPPRPRYASLIAASTHPLIPLITSHLSILLSRPSSRINVIFDISRIHASASYISNAYPTHLTAYKLHCSVVLQNPDTGEVEGVVIRKRGEVIAPKGKEEEYMNGREGWEHLVEQVWEEVEGAMVERMGKLGMVTMIMTKPNGEGKHEKWYGREEGVAF